MISTRKKTLAFKCETQRPADAHPLRSRRRAEVPEVKTGVSDRAKKYEIASVPKNEIVVYQPNETMRLEVELRDESAWLTQQKIADLFGVQKAAISKHLKNIFATGELIEEEVVSKMETTTRHGAIAGKTQKHLVSCYNLDAIIAVGYRVNSRMATKFRIWATHIIKEYLLRGYAVNARLNQLEDRIDRRMAKNEQDIVELRERVDFVVESALPAPEMVFMEGEFLTAHDALRKIVKAAMKRLVVIDNYIDERVLTLLAERRKGVSCRVYGKNAAKRDVQLAFSRYQQQYPNDGLTLMQWSNAHDRFIICDNTVWICGASIKDAGRRMFALVKTGLEPDVVLSPLPA